MPKTKSGKWSVFLIPAMVVLFFIGTSLAGSLYDSEPAGNTLIEDILSRPALAISMLAGFGAGIAAFVTGLISIIKCKERNILVFISTIIGAAVMVFLIAEFLSPLFSNHPPTSQETDSYSLESGWDETSQQEYYCLEVGWNEASQEYFNTHHLDCTFLNLKMNGTYILEMRAVVPQKGDICHEIDETTSPPTFTDVPCEYTFDDWVAAGSPSEYVIEGQPCLANFLFMLNQGLAEGEQVWGMSPVVNFTPSGEIRSSCIGNN